MKKLLFGSANIRNRYYHIANFILRLGAGLFMAFAHGIGKVPVSDKFVEGVAGMGFPLPEAFAWAAALSELLGGLFLALGLFTRPSALFLTITMVVAAFIRHGDDPFSSMEKSLLYGIIFLFFLLVGGGKFSLDGLIRNNSR